MWLGILHHVCGEHEWNEGQCSHGPLTEVEGGKEYLDMDSKAAKELKKIVLDKEWLKSLEFYVLFRYHSNRINVCGIKGSYMYSCMIEGTNISDLVMDHGPSGEGGGVIRTLSDRHERFFVWFEIYHSQISLSSKIWEVFFGVAWVVFFFVGGGITSLLCRVISGY